VPSFKESSFELIFSELRAGSYQQIHA